MGGGGKKELEEPGGGREPAKNLPNKIPAKCRRKGRPGAAGALTAPFDTAALQRAGGREKELVGMRARARIFREVWSMYYHSVAFRAYVLYVLS